MILMKEGTDLCLLNLTNGPHTYQIYFRKDSEYQVETALMAWEEKDPDFCQVAQKARDEVSQFFAAIALERFHGRFKDYKSFRPGISGQDPGQG
jgi:hypothetical protein